MITSYETNEYGEQIIVKTYSDGTVIKELDRPAPPVSPVPQSVSMRQARLALLGAGLLSTVDAAISAQDEPLKSQIEIEWVYATEIDRQWPTLLALAPALGLDSEDLDNLFIAASQL